VVATPMAETANRFAMKCTFILSLVVALGVLDACAQGAAGVIVKQRAKELRDQNNVRQGVAPPTPAARPAPPATPAKPGQPATAVANPRQQSISRLQSDLATLQGKDGAATEVKQRFARNLLAASQGPTKPSGPAVTRFVDDLAAAFPGRTLATDELTRLAQDLNAVFDCANLPTSQVQAILGDVQAILQVGGMKRQNAVDIVTDLRLVASQIQKPPPH
jgi:hypothetical protein